MTAYLKKILGISRIMLVKAFGREGAERQQFSATNDDLAVISTGPWCYGPGETGSSARRPGADPGPEHPAGTRGSCSAGTGRARWWSADSAGLGHGPSRMANNALRVTPAEEAVKMTNLQELPGVSEGQITGKGVSQ
jgi:hypothetical protein